MKRIPSVKLLLATVLSFGCAALPVAAHLKPSTAPGFFVKEGSIQGPAVTTFKDPLAAEPWSVAVDISKVIVTNYASDNISIISNADNSIQNLAVGDGPGGVPDGPFGIAPGFGISYITLF